MTHRLLAATLLTATTLLIPATASAEGFPSLHDDANPFSNISGSSPAADHAGLLGKMYLEGRYDHIQTDEPVIQPFDDTYQGFDVTFNAPIPWLNELLPGVGTDVFFNFQQLQIGGTRDINTLEMDVDSYSAGVSLYTSAFGPIRPFVQLGVQHDVIDALAAGPGGSGTFSDKDTSLLAILGLEADIAENAAVRLAIDLNEQAFNDPPITADVIFWPHERFYLRAGLFVTTDGNEIGGPFGGGVVF